MGEVIIRKAVEQDCAPMLELIKELADYEKALHEVTLTLEQFVETDLESHRFGELL